MRQRPVACAGLLVWLVVGGRAAAQSESIAPLVETLRNVEREAKGNRAATRAWAELTSQAGADQLPTILKGMDEADPLAANWLRAAVDAIAERELRQGGKLPMADLEQFLREKQHNQRARRLAYEWLARSDPSVPDRLIPQMLDDPALELRRDAVARVLASADAALKEEKTDAALAAYRKALNAGRDLDQVKAATDALKTLGQPIDLSHHFGFLTDWKLVGPFPNPMGKGFDTVYPPEVAVDLAASYETPEGKITWKADHTDEEYSHVDLNKALGKHMGVVGYATCEFHSDRKQSAELRLGSENANKIWLNGKLLSSADVYHANGTMDQYVGRGELEAGRNVILLKLCQNEQKEDWAQDWKFHLRVCDALGKAILSTDRAAPRVAERVTNAKPSPE